MEEITEQSSFWRSPGRRGGAPGPRRSRDPFVARIGAIVLIALLAIPVVAALSGGGDASGGPGDAAAISPDGGDGSIALIDPDAETTTTTAAPAPTTSSGQEPTTAAPAATEAAQAPAPTSAPAATRAETTEASTTTATASGSNDVAQTHVETLAAAAPATTEPACSGTYEVNGGDYWIGIADRAGVSTSELLQANGANPDTPLYPGATVCLPPGAHDPGPPPTSTTAAPATTAEPATTTTTTAAPTTTEAPTTTAAPTTTTEAPTTTQPPREYTRDEVTFIIASVFPEDQFDTALRIATRESNLQPGVRNWCCYGLFQIHWEAHRSWLAGMGVTSPEQLYDPLVNAQAAYALYQRSGGWGPWGGVPD